MLQNFSACTLFFWASPGVSRKRTNATDHDRECNLVELGFNMVKHCENRVICMIIIMKIHQNMIRIYYCRSTNVCRGWSKFFFKLGHPRENWGQGIILVTEIWIFVIDGQTDWLSCIVHHRCVCPLWTPKAALCTTSSIQSYIVSHQMKSVGSDPYHWQTLFLSGLAVNHWQTHFVSGFYCEPLTDTFSIRTSCEPLTDTFRIGTTLT